MWVLRAESGLNVARHADTRTGLAEDPLHLMFWALLRPSQAPFFGLRGAKTRNVRSGVYWRSRRPQRIRSATRPDTVYLHVRFKSRVLGLQGREWRRARSGRAMKRSDNWTCQCHWSVFDRSRVLLFDAPSSRLTRSFSAVGHGIASLSAA